MVRQCLVIMFAAFSNWYNVNKNIEYYNSHNDNLTQKCLKLLFETTQIEYIFFDSFLLKNSIISQTTELYRFHEIFHYNTVKKSILVSLNLHEQAAGHVILPLLFGPIIYSLSEKAPTLKVIKIRLDSFEQSF